MARAGISGAVTVNGMLSLPERQDALDKLRREILYRLELCPCSGETYQHADIELVETARS